MEIAAASFDYERPPYVAFRAGDRCFCGPSFGSSIERSILRIRSGISSMRRAAGLRDIDELLFDDSVITGGELQITRCTDNACGILRTKLSAK